MNFSVVVITRNEEKKITHLVNSLSDFQKRGGEIVVVDTGSTDDTVKVARELGCIVEEVGNRFLIEIDKEMADKVNQYAIVEDEEKILKAGDTIFDFASARNYAASLAKNDMVAMPDADEVYTRLDLDKINEQITNGVEQCEYNFVFSHDQYGNEAIKFLHCKFYNRTKLKWVGIIHEVLSGNAKKMFLDESIIKLEHWQNEETGRTGYLKGLALDCYHNPNNDRNSHYFGRELLWRGRIRSAIRELKRHIEMNKWPAEKAQSMIFIGDAYGLLNEPEEQVSWYNRAFYTDSSRREALIKLARFYQHNDNKLAAAAFASAALQIPWNAYYGNNMAHYTYEPYEILYWAKGWLGEIELAREYLNKCLEFCPTDSIYLRDYRYYNVLPKISILLPTLGRPEGLERVKKSIDELNYPKELIEILIQEDEPRLGVPKRVNELAKKATGEWLVYASNDIAFTPDSLILAILKGKKLVSFNTGEVLPDQGNICEHFIIHRSLYEEQGFIFDEDFNHCGCDNLLWNRFQSEAARCEEAIVHHYHFSKGNEMDEVYKMGWKNVEQDRQLLARKLQVA